MVGGQAVDISDLPYAASILHLGEHICGGVIVSRYFVLTAASCFKKYVLLFLTFFFSKHLLFLQCAE